MVNGDVWADVVARRRRWPLIMQARHAARFPGLWPVAELARLVAEIKREGM